MIIEHIDFLNRRASHAFSYEVLLSVARRKMTAQSIAISFNVWVEKCDGEEALETYLERYIET